MGRDNKKGNDGVLPALGQDGCSGDQKKKKLSAAESRIDWSDQNIGCEAETKTF